MAELQNIAASMAQPVLEYGQNSLALWTHIDFSPVHRDFATVHLTCSYFSSPPVVSSFTTGGLQNLVRRGGAVGREKEVEPKHQKQQPQQKVMLWMVFESATLSIMKCLGRSFPWPGRAWRVFRLSKTKAKLEGNDILFNLCIMVEAWGEGRGRGVVIEALG